MQSHDDRDPYAAPPTVEPVKGFVLADGQGRIVPGSFTTTYREAMVMGVLGHVSDFFLQISDDVLTRAWLAVQGDRSIIAASIVSP